MNTDPYPKTITPAPDAAQRVSAPAVALLIMGILGILLTGLSLIIYLIGTGFSAIMAQSIDEKFMQLFTGGIGAISSLVGLVIAVIIIYASLQMRKLNSWGLCMAASIMAMIPFISPCCIIGLPIGIWGLVVLSNPEIKAAFNISKQAY